MISRKYLGVFIIVFTILLLSGCPLFQREPKLLTSPLDPGVQQVLADAVRANGGDEVVPNLANDGVFDYIEARIGICGKNKSNSPRLFMLLEKARERHLALSRGPGGSLDPTTGEEPAEGDGHAVVQLELKEDSTIFASAYGSVYDGREVVEDDKRPHIFMDVRAWDLHWLPKTEYIAAETFDTNSISCSAKGTYNIAKGRDADDYFVQADSMLAYEDYDTNGDGVIDENDDPNDPVLRITFAYMGTKPADVTYPTTMTLIHPYEKNAPDPSLDDKTVCTVCLERSARDCDYSIDVDHRGQIFLPFKGEIVYQDARILLDASTGDGGGIEMQTWGKPDPAAVDMNGEFIRNINLVLGLDNGGIGKRIKPISTTFFWNNNNTWAYYNPDTGTSRLVWDLIVQFPDKCWNNSDKVDFFVTIDVPVRQTAAHKATAFIIPEAYYDGTPYKFYPNIEKMNLPEGYHTLEVRGKTDSTEQANPTVYRWTVDTTPPVAEIVNKPRANTVHKKAELSVGGTDVVTYQYKESIIYDPGTPAQRIEAGDWSPLRDIKEPIVCDTSGDSYLELRYIVSVRGADKAGNLQAEADSTDYSWTIVPGLSSEAYLENTPELFSPVATAAVTVSGLGLETYDYRLDGGIRQYDYNIGIPINLVGLSNGMHTLEVWGFDGVTMQVNPTVFKWTVNAALPVAELFMPKTSDNIFSSPDIEIEVGGENVTGYDYSLDSGAAVEGKAASERIGLTGLSNGSHTIRVYAVNRAGRKQSSPTAYTFTVNRDAAVLSLTGTPPVITGNPNFNVELVGNAIKSYRYKVDLLSDGAVSFPDRVNDPEETNTIYGMDNKLSITIPLEDLFTMPKMQFVWSCVAAGTPIKMADGSEKAIETIKEGDYVMSENGLTLPVYGITTGTEHIPMYRLIDADGRNVLITQGHPVLMGDNTIKLVRNIEPGDYIRTENGTSIVEKVSTEMYEGVIYNLTLGYLPDITRPDHNGYAMIAGGILIGDEKMQRVEMSRADKPKGPVLSRIPERWRYDYLHSPLRKQ
ncbi:MAG: hypothetical protein JW881_00125 [Spirochaetales bacterium]|nr:hypothetical protein [Spirochaetales bacterium]